MKIIFDYNLNTQYKNINNLNDINYNDNYILHNKLNFKTIKYNTLYKYNKKLIENVFKNILFLNLKKYYIHLFR